DSVISSFIEFINSFRDSNNSSQPQINSPEAIKALEKFKYLKEQISSDSIFQSPDTYTIEKLFRGGAIFLRFWYIEHIPLYTASALPGNKSGVSGTLSIANNIGINKYIDEERIKAAVEIMKFLTSKETQKNYIIKNHVMSAITSLYYEEDVCSMIDCRVVTDAMPMNTMLFENDGYGNDSYLYKTKKYLIDFIMIINIPDTNSYSTWVQSHLHFYMFLMFLIEFIILLSRFLIPLYEIEKVIIPEGKNFNKCNKSSGFGVVVYYIEIVYMLIIQFCILFMSFIEWNLKATSYQIRYEKEEEYQNILKNLKLDAIISSTITNDNNDNYTFEKATYHRLNQEEI
ncbi:hypothetical protein PIROE2DRAFT_5704, partial [Piromyces sp. E2]